ncbi:hypothetical protein [Hymenobacter negativus]|uniref:GAF domain-containing protein n=1 Tax=Hymenobacter negativus TaxID=2795026 RepID=A0ABS3QM31_9BACT|nr:hypothetical protein [Hymenobacter negativus]MBO2012187.1 hypothetical protein [Hymenobacter negativus]
MRRTDFDFALDLLTQADLQPVEMASTGLIGLMATLDKKGLVAWVFDDEGNFLRFEKGLILAG